MLPCSRKTSRGPAVHPELQSRWISLHQLRQLLRILALVIYNFAAIPWSVSHIRWTDIISYTQATCPYISTLSSIRVVPVRPSPPGQWPWTRCMLYWVFRALRLSETAACRSSVELDQLCLHECTIIGKGGAHWPQPTYKVVAMDRADEPLLAKSCTGCWTQVPYCLYSTAVQNPRTLPPLLLPVVQCSAEP